MELSKWRSRAELVAYVDLIASIIGLLNVLGMVGCAIYLTVSTAALFQFVDWLRPEEDPDTEKLIEVADSAALETKYIALMWTSVGISVLFTIIQFCATISLMKATEVGRDRMQAVNMCACWMYICTFFLIISIMNGVMAVFLINDTYRISVGIIMGIYIFWRGAFLFIVYNYSYDLVLEIGFVPRVATFVF